MQVYSLLAPNIYIWTAVIIMLAIAYASYKLSHEYFNIVNYKVARKKLLVINVILAVVFFIIAPPPKWLSYDIATPLFSLIILWYILQIILGIWCSILVIFRKIYAKINTDSAPSDPSRRRFFQKILWAPPVALTLYGGLYEAREIEFTTVDIPTSNKKLQGMTIAQLSDVHIGLFFSLEKLERTLKEIIAKAPDMLVITGDIFDDKRLNPEAVQIVNRYSVYFPFGVYFVWGNHEHLRGIPELQKLLADTNIKLLDNQAVKIFSAPDAFYLIGVDYARDVDVAKCQEFMSKAMQNVPDDSYKILLAHHPTFIDNAKDYNIDLTLSGHTHGGQMTIFGIAIPLFKYMRGMYVDGDRRGYVSSGAGSWFPYRIMCPPEVTFFKFVQK